MAVYAPQIATDELVPETTALTGQYRIDLRTSPPDIYIDESETNWADLRWQDIGKPVVMRRYSSLRREWEYAHEKPMPLATQWEYYNRSVHELFSANVPLERRIAMRKMLKYMRAFDFGNIGESLQELHYLSIWNRLHRFADAVWDPRGFRTLFGGLPLEKPNILFLGAGDGFEAMQLQALYPGGKITMVDCDEFAKTTRFGKFPENYPFLGKDNGSGQWKIYNKADFNIDYIVEDINDLNIRGKFDVVMSAGLLDHFPNMEKPGVFEWYRYYLKPGGYGIVTTPRLQGKSRLFFFTMKEITTFGYRELMSARQLGLYAYDNGFVVQRCAAIKAHNGVVLQLR